MPRFDRLRCAKHISIIPGDAAVSTEDGQAVCIVGSIPAEEEAASAAGRRAWLLRVTGRGGGRFLVGVVSEAWRGPYEELPGADDRPRFAASSSLLPSEEPETEGLPRIACEEGHVLRAEVDTAAERLWLWAPAARGPAAQLFLPLRPPAAASSSGGILPRQWSLCVYLYRGTRVTLISDRVALRAAGVERAPAALLPGRPVVPGPDWEGGEAAEEGVVEAAEGDGWLAVRWPGGRATREAWGAAGRYSVAIAPTEEDSVAGRLAILPADRLVGRLVTRGLEWESGAEDGAPGNVGMVVGVASSEEEEAEEGEEEGERGAVWVRWSSDTKGAYKWGRGGVYELRVLPGPAPAQAALAAVQPELLRGLRCIRGPNWRLRKDPAPALADLPPNFELLLGDMAPADLEAVTRRLYEQTGVIEAVHGAGARCWVAVRWEGDPSPAARLYRWPATDMDRRYVSLIEEPPVPSAVNSEGRTAKLTRNGRHYCGGPVAQCGCAETCEECGPYSGCNCGPCRALDEGLRPVGPLRRPPAAFDERQRGARVFLPDPCTAWASVGPSGAVSAGGVARGTYTWRLDARVELVHQCFFYLGIVDDSFAGPLLDAPPDGRWARNFVQSAPARGVVLGAPADLRTVPCPHGRPLHVTVDATRRTVSYAIADSGALVAHEYALPTAAEGAAPPAARLCYFLFSNCQVSISRGPQQWRWSEPRRDPLVTSASPRELEYRPLPATEATKGRKRGRPAPPKPFAGAALDSFLDRDLLLPGPGEGAPPARLAHEWHLRVRGPCCLALVEDEDVEAALAAGPADPAGPWAAPVVEHGPASARAGRGAKARAAAAAEGGADAVLSVRVDLTARTLAVRAAGGPEAAPRPIRPDAARLNLVLFLAPMGRAELVRGEEMLPPPTAGVHFDLPAADLNPGHSNRPGVAWDGNTRALPLRLPPLPPGQTRATAHFSVTDNTRFFVGVGERAMMPLRAERGDRVPAPSAAFLKTSTTKNAPAIAPFRYADGARAALTLDFAARCFELRTVDPRTDCLQTLRGAFPSGIPADELTPCVVVHGRSYCVLLNYPAATGPAPPSPAVPDSDRALVGADIVGRRVARGGDWCWGDQDGGPGALGPPPAAARAASSSRGAGRVEGVEESVGEGQDWLVVRWDGGARNVYRWGVDGRHDVALCAEEAAEARPAAAPAPPADRPGIREVVGRKVRRGPNWSWANQDGGAGTLGHVERRHGEGWVRVRWPHGRANFYRWGAEGAYDLELPGAPGSEPAPRAGPSRGAPAAAAAAAVVRHVPLNAWVRSVAVSADGRLVAGCSHDSVVLCRLPPWAEGLPPLETPVAGPPVVLRQPHGDESTACVALSPDGARLATGGHDGTVRLWETAGGARLAVLPALREWVHAVAFARGSQLVAAASGDGAVTVFDAAADPPAVAYRVQAHGGKALCLALAEAAAVLFSGGQDGRVRAWEVGTGRAAAGHGAVGGLAGEVASLAASPDGTRLATADDEKVQLWDALTGAELRRWPGLGVRPRSLALFQEGAHCLVLCGRNDGTVRLWGTDGTDRRLADRLHGGPVLALALARGGHTLATGCSDGGLRCLRLSPALLAPGGSRQARARPFGAGAGDEEEEEDGIGAAGFGPWKRPRGGAGCALS